MNNGKNKSGVKMEWETIIKAHKGSHHSEKSWQTRGRMGENDPNARENNID